MNISQIAKDALLVAAAGAAGYCAYRWLPSSDKSRISRDMKQTAEDLGDVRRDIGRVAGTIKDTF